jgi:peptide chain release factor 3
MSRNKQFRKGIQQLSEEGVVQVYYSIDAMRRDPILAAVGQLQFDVVEARFLQEYAVRTRTSPLPYVAARWPDAPLEEVRKLKNMGSSTVLARDSHERIVLLFNSAWNMQQVIESNPTVQFRLTG